MQNLGRSISNVDLQESSIIELRCCGKQRKLPKSLLTILTVVTNDVTSNESRDIKPVTSG